MNIVTTPKIHKIIQEVKTLAKKSPDNIYNKPKYSTSCFYDKGECEDGSIGCIFGQVFKKFGMEIQGQEPIKYILIKHGIKRTHYQSLWCEKVQEYQDIGITWGDAVKKANQFIYKFCRRRS